MRGAHAGGNRAENMDRLTQVGRLDLFYRILFTLLIMDERGITQADVAKHLGKSATWARWALTAEPRLSLQKLDDNLMEVDRAITAISLERGVVFE